MENPFRDNGPVDKVMAVMALVVSSGLLADGLSMYRHGASPLWPLAAAATVLLACHEIYRRFFRTTRRRRK